MLTRKIALAAGASLALLPIAAQAESAQFAPVEHASELGDEANLVGTALGIAIGAALILILIEVTDDDEDLDEPVSV